MRLAVMLLLLPALPATPPWVVYLTHAGPIRLGMTVAEVRRVLHDPKAYLEGDIANDTPLSECAYLQSRALPRDLGLMVIEGRLVRIDIAGTGIRTASGAGVGDNEARIQALYPGRLTVKPHPYFDNGHYLSYAPRVSTQ